MADPAFSCLGFCVGPCLSGVFDKFQAENLEIRAFSNTSIHDGVPIGMDNR
jgi:hypothetical protein